MEGLRVIAGTLKGRIIHKPKDLRVRPATHKTREAIFDILAESVQGARVLDCFAGAGSYGIEAISRGAAHATFVEINRDTAACLNRTITELNIAGRTTVHTGDIRIHLRKMARDGLRPDLVFLDPPFIEHYFRMLLENPHLACVLAPGALAVLEYPRPLEQVILPLAAARGYQVQDLRSYGQVGVAFMGRLKEPPPPPLYPSSRKEPDP